MSVHKYKTKKGDKWYVKVDNHTKRGFDKKTDAIQYEAKIKLKQESPESFTTFNHLVEDFLDYAEKNVTYGTFQKKEVVIKKIILPNTEDKKIFKINELDCRKFRNAVEHLEYSTAYKNYILRIYKSLFKHAEIYFGLKNNPTYVLESFRSTFDEKMKKKEKEKMCVWSVNEFQKFIVEVENEKYKVFFIILFYTGMRLGEAQALQWKDFYNGNLHILKSLTSKTKKGSYEIKEPKTVSSIREIPLGDTLNDFLLKYKSKQLKKNGFNESWYIFGGSKPLPSTTITRQKDIAIKKAGVNRISLHDFRHSHASNLISSGMNIVAVSKRLGHGSVEITLNVYTHLIKDNEEQVIEYINSSSQILLNEKKGIKKAFI